MTASAGAPVRREVRSPEISIRKGGEARLGDRGSPQGNLFEMLEPYEGKLSRTVLRGGRSRKAPLRLGAAMFRNA